MKIVVTIQHPAHVHFFKNAVRQLSEHHQVTVFVREKDVATELLEGYGIPYETLAGPTNSFLELAYTQLIYESRLLRRAREIEPDVMAAIAEPGVAHVATVVGSTGLIFTDTEHATLQNKLAFPFCDAVYTPTCYRNEIGEKQIRYSGYHELAYLHPDRFEPNPDVLADIDAREDESLVVMRLVSWDAAHDVGNSGFDRTQEVVSRLERTGARVLLTSESPLPNSLEQHRIDISPCQIHDLMYYSELFVGESPTMATESAVLGTPAIYASSIELGYVTELSEQYGLIFEYNGADRQSKSIEKALEILRNTSAQTWERKRERLLSEKVDTTEYMIQEITKHE
ncbi:DUF354 domain-containing protein [Natrarchaeobius halalkaliphilus]|uniref:DUF354 domain-containing protein n=1 Tax=Natrarchaeobius halalkaliphilus TaxID=1679091 RepID=A0A3N6LKM7_9EURY|nr:DUF354 domain-containing protein [Natrarchaeobius halalkaliphilus]RQG89218.1 DUF354 domain-containing protein [Natrarchaeobius halalkaliphilus]